MRDNHVSLVDAAGQRIARAGLAATAALTRAVTRMALSLGSIGLSDLTADLAPGSAAKWRHEPDVGHLSLP
jgi:hypothetical protein